MKVFIIFSAIFMMGMTCMIYQGDVNVYMHEQETLKMIAEEAACQAALCLDDEAYGEGIMRFDTETAYAQVMLYTDEARKLLAYGDTYDFDIGISFEDDEKGYTDSNEDRNPTVTVTVKAAGDDFFRLPFLYKNTITRKSKYEVQVF